MADHLLADAGFALDVARLSASAELPGIPAPPAGFTIDIFARAPEIHSPASICVTPNGEVFVGEDEYNSGGKIVPETSRVKMCVDTDGDDEADRFTVFADKVNAPQGMTFVGDTLYVVHALRSYQNDDGGFGHGLEGVHRFARLSNGEREGAWLDDRVAIAIL